jgi:hypothetical protein
MAEETESQRAIRQAIEADQERRRAGRRAVERVTDIPDEECPGCHGNAGSNPCEVCGI